jgi:Ca-activated chloride channel family protein
MTLGVFLLSSFPTYADGIIIPDPPPGVPITEVPNLAIKYHHVRVTIEDQVATTHVDQVFVNETRHTLEGIYIFPLPEEAAISEFAMWVEGEKIEGKILEKEEARRIYEEIVRKRKDPALLEYIGRNTFRASIFPIPPGEERRIEVKYSEVLPMDKGLVKYIYPLDTERFSSKPIEEVTISVEIRSREPLKAIHSPSHEVAIDRIDDYNARVGYEEYDVLPDRDFELYYTISAEDFGLNLLSYKKQEEDGFFLLLVAPKVETEEQEIVAKDVIFVLDTSGSMKGEKLHQAKEALSFVLESLNEEDRFNIIAFSTGVRRYSKGLVPADEREEALRFVRKLRAVGGTDINRAILTALRDVEERPTIIIFLTDGLPTEGVVEVDSILENVKEAAKEVVRIFTFGVGDDVNTILLDTMAQEHRGASAYVRPGQSIEEEVSAFYAKVSTPLLAEVELDFGETEVFDTYPYPLPDIFAGTQLALVGRYREGGSTTITLQGEVNEQRQKFTYEDITFRSEGGEDFIPRLWATRKIGYLLTQIRLHGESEELIEEIVELSIRYGIITPYTSFLVEEPEEALTDEGRERIVEVEATRIVEAPVPAWGAKAVDVSVAQEALRSAETAVRPTTAEVKHVGDKAFVLHEGTWIDTTFDPKRMKTTKVGFASESYFALLRAHPEWGKYFALGRHVIVVLDGVAYEIEEGEFEPEDISPEEIKLVLTADVTEGEAPLTVNFTAELIGGPDNNPDYYCVEQEFDFGDGIKMAVFPHCEEYTPDVVIQRHFTTSYTYEEAGTYVARFRLRDLESNPVTVVVISPYPTPTPAPAEVGKPICGGLFAILLFPLIVLLGLRRMW